MLHTRSRDALHFGEVCTLVLQPLEHEVDGVEEQGDRCENLTLAGVGEHALFNAIFGEVGVKVDFGFVDELEVRLDNNSCEEGTSVEAMAG